MSAIPFDLIATTLARMQFSSRSQADERWPTFEEILQRLHAEGIYIHSEQLAEFLLAHGLPVHLRYVPEHLRLKAVAINENYQGDMVRVIEELEPASGDFSWIETRQKPPAPKNQNKQANRLEESQPPF
ncbi:MAG: hypothetical protein ICV63_05170 [Coleofasciculus sp. Co-bin14]|nr:hypothetical protein [Coleofasciculus sp. Co-bin14]